MHNLMLVFLLAGQPTNSDPFVNWANAVIKGEKGPQPQWKLDLIKNALNKGEQSIPAKTTSYWAHEPGVGHCTASGKRVFTCNRGCCNQGPNSGFVAADVNHNKHWKFNTVLWIEGYGVCRIWDTGGAIRGKHRFDLGMTPSQGKRYGTQTKRYLVLSYPTKKFSKQDWNCCCRNKE